MGWIAVVSGIPLLLQFSHWVYERKPAAVTVPAGLPYRPITEQLAYDAVGLIRPQELVKTTPTHWGQEIL